MRKEAFFIPKMNPEEAEAFFLKEYAKLTDQQALLGFTF
jgi:hypothetical protein